jgi:hypothetical protein
LWRLKGRYPFRIPSSAFGTSGEGSWIVMMRPEEAQPMVREEGSVELETDRSTLCDDLVLLAVVRDEIAGFIVSDEPMDLARLVIGRHAIENLTAIEKHSNTADILTVAVVAALT